MSNVYTVRASSFGTLLDCAMRWEGTHILGIRRPSSGAAHLGTSLHYAAGTFDSERINGTAIRLDDAAGLFVHSLHHPEEEVNWEGESVKEAETIGIKLTTGYCTTWAPQFEYRAVEMQLEPMDIETRYGTIRLTGRMDRARVAPHVNVEGHGLRIIDLKSGKRAVDPKTGFAITKDHGPQLGVYSILAEHTLKEPVDGAGGIIGLHTTRDVRIGVGVVHNAREQLIGTPEQPGLIEHAAHILNSGLFAPNPQSRLCSPKYCSRWDSCKFHE